jgi:glycosyltransferase involved in cell wall biosynthesis
MALALGIAPRIGFTSFQHNTANLYRALDIVVHASTEPEPFGLTIIEAMACGKPVVVAQAGGAAELFTHNQDAVGVPPGDAIALASAVGRLVDDPGYRQRLADQARRNVVQRFSHERLGPQILAVYSRFLSLSAGTRSSRTLLEGRTKT